MKKLLLCLLWLPSISSAQYIYVARSPYLINPDKIIGYVDSCAKFWTNVYDPVLGGFWTDVDVAGRMISGSGKNMMNQTRDAYGFTRAFQLTGDTAYLTYARRALDFMYKSAWDKTYGGWTDNVNKNGVPTDPNASKSAYNQHYAMLGITAYYEATRDTSDFRRLMESYAWNDLRLWDSRPQYFGYYDYVAANGTAPAGKTFNATVDAITTHLLHLYLLTGDTLYSQRMQQVADNMLNRLTASVDQQAIGFCEKYDADWNPKSGTSDETMTIMGHVLKTAWCFARLYSIAPNPAYLAAAEKLVKSVLDKGYDHQNGGPYKDYNRITGDMLMWGKADTAKAWWQMEQAVTAGLLLYRITGKDMYLEMADETLEFFMKYFVDHTYGDVYQNRTKYGAQIWDLNKGNSGKGGYHSIELGYYVYLYGNLLVNHRPVTLYYRFVPDARDRDILLNPISFLGPQIWIGAVTRNNTLWTDFNLSKRLLHIPAGTGGVFAVTFRTIPSEAVEAGSVAVPRSAILLSNYPNPFNGQTNFQFSVLVDGMMSLKIYDVLGREVSTVVDGFSIAGTFTRRWDSGSLPSGIYFSVLKCGSQSLTTRLVLMR
jgi:cellobiose epimerase